MTDKPDVKETMWELARIMDGLLPTLNRAADVEFRDEAGKQIRKITHQRRFDAAKAAVARAYEIMGVRHG